MQEWAELQFKEFNKKEESAVKGFKMYWNVIFHLKPPPRILI